MFAKGSTPWIVAVLIFTTISGAGAYFTKDPYMKFVAYMGVMFFVFLLWFFRDPDRNVKICKNCMVLKQSLSFVMHIRVIRRHAGQIDRSFLCAAFTTIMHMLLLPIMSMPVSIEPIRRYMHRLSFSHGTVSVMVTMKDSGVVRLL